MNCKSCGQSLTPNLKFCDKCGAQVEVAVAATPSSTTAASALTTQPTNPQAPVNANLVQEIASKAKLTAIMAMVVSGLNLGIILLLAVFSEKLEVNWLIVGVQGVLLVGLSILGFLLYGKINNIPEVKKLIQFMIFPLMGVIVLIGLLTGGGGIGILPLLILLFGSQTIQKITEYEKTNTK